MIHQKHLDRLQELADRIYVGMRANSHRSLIKARIEHVEAIEAAIAELSPHVALCTCDGGKVHDASCDAVCGGEGGGA